MRRPSDRALGPDLDGSESDTTTLALEKFRSCVQDVRSHRKQAQRNVGPFDATVNTRSDSFGLTGDLRPGFCSRASRQNARRATNCPAKCNVGDLAYSVANSDLEQPADFSKLAFQKTYKASDPIYCRIDLALRPAQYVAGARRNHVRLSAAHRFQHMRQGHQRAQMIIQHWKRRPFHIMRQLRSRNRRWRGRDRPRVSKDGGRKSRSIFASLAERTETPLADQISQ